MVEKKNPLLLFPFTTHQFMKDIKAKFILIFYILI